MGLLTKVPSRTESQIEDLANRLLTRTVGYRFNVMKLIRATMMQESPNRAPLSLRIISPRAKCKTPFVQFDPFELHMTQVLKNAGDLNLPWARHVLAHELAHMIMHRFYPSFFSASRSVKLNFLNEDESAECQAQTFTGYLLIPERLFLEHNVNIQDTCSVPAELVVDRRRQFEKRVEAGYYVPRLCECGASLAKKESLEISCCGCQKREQL